MGVKGEAKAAADHHQQHEVHAYAQHIPYAWADLPPRGLTGLLEAEVPHGLHLAGIKRGYRMGGTYGECLWGHLGLFAWHNQTLNAHTMIWGVMVASAALAWTLWHLAPSGGPLSAFLALWLSPLLHLPASVGYHLFLCLSPKVLREWRALDVFFIFVASVPLTYALSFFVYAWPATLAATAFSSALALHAWHNAHKLPAGREIKKHVNTAYVGIAVLVYSSPVLFQAASDLLTGAGAASGYYSVAAAGSLVFSLAYGAAVYVCSFPDRHAPGVFDYVGAAQQLMHMGALGALICEWLFMWHRYMLLYGAPKA